MKEKPLLVKEKDNSTKVFHALPNKAAM